MNWWIIPVTLKPAEIDIDRPIETVFRYVTPFRHEQSKRPRLLKREPEGLLLVEFDSQVRGLLGGVKTYRTVERVWLNEPYEIRFQGVEGPLDLLSDRFLFTETRSGTHMRYESSVGLRGSILGWLLCQTYVRIVLGRFMRKHVAELKRNIEAAVPPAA